MKVRYSVIVPVFNEEEVIKTTYQRLTDVMEGLDDDYELLFVNDGSRDRTLPILEEIARWDKSVRILDFSRNFGHQAAITAGMDHAAGEAIVVIDADLQDPPEIIAKMIELWKEGYEVVYGRRLKREGETLFKKATAVLFYRILRAATDIDIPLDTGDFRLIDRKVCDAMKTIRERNRFVRGLISWVGFRQTAVEYVREERFAGETKYPFKKMLRFAMDGISSFSFQPLKIAGYLGGLVTAISLAVIAYCIFIPVTSAAIPAWMPVTAVLAFLNGLILIMMGAIGEYIGRIYDETRNRPLYILREPKDLVPARQRRWG